MPRQRIEIRRIASTEEWLRWRREDVTGSEIGALFGFHPRETIYGLFHRALGMPVPTGVSNAAIERGNDLEDAAAKKFARQHPEFRVRKAGVYLRDPERRIGATPDYFLRTRDGHKGVLEIKTVDPKQFREFWTPETCPLWVVLQTLTQMMLARASFGKVAAWEFSSYVNRLHVYDVNRHAASERRIYDAVAEFWRCVENCELPKPDYKRDGALIAAMYANAKPGTTIDLRHDNHLPTLLAERAAINQEIADKEKRCKEIEAEIRDKIGENEAALVSGWRVTLKEIHKKEHMVKASSYRQLRAVREEKFEDNTGSSPLHKFDPVGGA